MSLYLEVPVECCVCKRLHTSLDPGSPGLEPRKGSLIVCSCGAVLSLCGTPEKPHTHQVVIMTPKGLRPATRQEALAVCIAANAPMN